MTDISSKEGQKAGIRMREERGMTLTDPTALNQLVSPNAKLADVSSPLKWLSFLMVLYYHGLPLSVLGNWCGVHKTTVLRWILGGSLALWPIISQWLSQQVKGTIVYIDEKWLKIQGKWHYWFVLKTIQLDSPLWLLFWPRAVNGRVGGLASN